MTLYSLMNMNSSYDFIWSNEHETEQLRAHLTHLIAILFFGK